MRKRKINKSEIVDMLHSLVGVESIIKWDLYLEVRFKMKMLPHLRYAVRSSIAFYEET